MNLIYVAYTISNFDKKMPILVIFSESAHLRKSKKKLHHFGKIPYVLLSDCGPTHTSLPPHCDS